MNSDLEEVNSSEFANENLLDLNQEIVVVDEEPELLSKLAVFILIATISFPGILYGLNKISFYLKLSELHNLLVGTFNGSNVIVIEIMSYLIGFTIALINFLVNQTKKSKQIFFGGYIVLPIAFFIIAAVTVIAFMLLLYILFGQLAKMP